MNNLKDNNITNNQSNGNDKASTLHSSFQSLIESKTDNNHSTSSSQDQSTAIQSIHNGTKKCYTDTLPASSAEWRIPTLLTLIFIFFVETSRLHPSLSFAGKAWILVMSSYTFKNRRLGLLLKYLLIGILFYTMTKFAVAALACRYDLGYLSRYLDMGKQISYHAIMSSSSSLRENGQSRGLNDTIVSSAPSLSSRMQV